MQNSGKSCSVKWKLVSFAGTTSILLVAAVVMLLMVQQARTFGNITDRTSIVVGEFRSNAQAYSVDMQGKQVYAAREALEQKVKGLCGLVAKSSAVSISTFDFEDMTNYCSDVCQDKDIIFACILSPDETPLTMNLNKHDKLLRAIVPADEELTIKAVCENLEGKEQVLSLREEVENQDGEVIGEVIIVADTRVLQERKEAIEEQFEGFIQKMTTGGARLMEEIEAVSSSGRQAAIRMSVVIGIVGIALLVAILTFLASRLIKPLVRVADTLKDISEGEGDLTARLVVSSNDEIGRLAWFFNKFVEKIQNIIRDVARDTTLLTSASEELLATSTGMASEAEKMSSQSNTASLSTKDLSTNLTSMASGAGEMSESVNTVAAAIEEMSVSIREVAGSCSKGSEIASNANSKARSTCETMEQLKESAGQIGKVLDMITDIVDKLNLLALNATIEAASAGGAGKGFAVVANEVKELATQTTLATDEIGQKVQEMQDNTASAVQAINDIAGVIEQVNSVTQTIASAVEEQSATINEIAQSMNSASTVTGKISDNVQVSSSTAEEISTNIQGVDSAAHIVTSGAGKTSARAEELVGLGARLQELVEQFKVDSTAVDEVEGVHNPADAA
ncbi:MAG: methyl-accepting chemotaxis protein [Candidatus Eisenbacteria sp.]|nr:methyl-accepting chemotaxis protein [Candidatus Eisenbacteria bacterium]